MDHLDDLDLPAADAAVLRAVGPVPVLVVLADDDRGGRVVVSDFHVAAHGAALDRARDLAPRRPRVYQRHDPAVWAEVTPPADPDPPAPPAPPAPPTPTPGEPQ